MRIPEDRSRWVLSENICICWVTARNLEVMIEIIPKNAKNDEKWLWMTEKWLKISHRMKRNIPLDRSCEVLSENIYICWVISKTVRVVMEKPFMSPKNAFFGYKTQKTVIFPKTFFQHLAPVCEVIVSKFQPVSTFFVDTAWFFPIFGKGHITSSRISNLIAIAIAFGDRFAMIIA